MHNSISNYAQKAYFLESQGDHFSCARVLGKGGSPSEARECNGNILLALGDIFGGSR